MSDENKNNEEGQKRKYGKTNSDPIEVTNTRRVSPVPVLPDARHGNIDKDKMRELYMLSKHLEWTPFAKSINIDPVRSRSEFPFKGWVKEKKNKLLLETAETMSESLFNLSAEWQGQIVKTLKEYPESADMMMKLINEKMNSIVEGIQSDKKNGNRNNFDKVWPASLNQLAGAMKQVVETKMKLLMIDKWSISAAQQGVQKTIEDSDTSTENQNDWTITIKGGQDFTGKEFENMMTQWVDRKPEIELEPGPNEVPHEDPDAQD